MGSTIQGKGPKPGKDFKWSLKTKTKGFSTWVLQPIHICVSNMVELHQQTQPRSMLPCQEVPNGNEPIISFQSSTLRQGGILRVHNLQANNPASKGREDRSHKSADQEQRKGAHCASDKVGHDHSLTRQEVREAKDLSLRMGAVSTQPGGTQNLFKSTSSSPTKAALVALSAFSLKRLLACAFTQEMDREP